MKRTGIAAFLVILALAAGLTLFNRCSGGDMATVTIRFHLNEIVINSPLGSILRKALDAIMPPAFANSAFTKDDVTAIYLTVTGPGMEQISVEIPPTADQHTIILPPGKDRLFTVSAYRSDPYSGVIQKLFEGSNTISLEAGDIVSLTIEMIQVWQP